ncbi:hypothetical protein JL722_7102 [Aureococcus anophagefferens]|nr:hypothetical protein JL722_7102 [Aureococcus anophagefferens]
MASTKVMVRDKVAAERGGQLLTLDGAMAHALTLNLSDRNLSDGDCKHMASTLLDELRRRFQEVTLMRNRSALLEVNIKLQDNAIGDRGCSALVTTLLLTSGIARIKSLLLHNNRISDEGALRVAELLEKAKHPVGEVRLGGNPAVTGRGARAVLDAARRRDTFASLPRARVAGAGLRRRQRPGYAAGARFSRPNPHRPLFRGDGARLWLRVADLDPPLRDDELANLAERIVEEVAKKRETARLPTTGTLFELRLDLQGGDVADDGVRGLVDALASLRDVVRDLRLYKNRVGDGGAAALAELLQTQRKPMEELHLSDNRVTDAASASATGFGEPLAMAIHLDDNALGDYGAIAIAGALLDVSTLVRVTKLSLARNRIGDQGARGVADLVESLDEPIADVDLSHNRLTKPTTPRRSSAPAASEAAGAQARAAKPAPQKPAPAPKKPAEPTSVLARKKKPAPPPEPADDGPGDDETDEEKALEAQIAALQSQLAQKKRAKSPAPPKRAKSPAPPKRDAAPPRARTPPRAASPPPRPATPDDDDDVPGAEPLAAPKAAPKPKPPGSGPLVGASMRTYGYSEKHAKWIEGAFLRCEKRAPLGADGESWVLFEPSDVYKYGLRGSLQPAEQRSLQDRMLRKGCVSIVTVAPRKDSTAVSVLACLESLQDYSQEQIRAILDACMDDARANRRGRLRAVKEDLEQAVAAEKKKPKKKKPKKAPAPPADAAAPPATRDDAPARRSRGARETEPPAKAPAPVVKAPAPVVKAPAPVAKAPEPKRESAVELQKRVERGGSSPRSKGPGARGGGRGVRGARRRDGGQGRLRVARRVLDALGRDEWDYVVGSVGGGGDNVSTVLDAFLPAFKELGDAALQGAAVACVLDGAKAGPAGDLADFRPEEAHPDPGGEGDDDDEQTPMAPHVLRKWARVVAKAKRRETSATTTAAAWELKGATPGQRRVARGAQWHRGDDARGPPQGPAKRVSAEDAAKAKRKKDREDARLRAALERYGSRPSNGGWKSSIRSPNIVYGKESSKIRYFEGKVVSTSGQKEVIIKDDSDATKVPQVVKKNGTVRAAK